MVVLKKAVAVVVAAALTLAAGAVPARAAGWVPTTLQDADRYSGEPDVAVAADGSAVEVWDAYDEVRASVRAAGGGWSQPVTLGPGVTVASPAIPASAPQVVIGSDGTATVIWVGDVGGTFTLLVASKAPGQAWSAATPLDTTEVSLFPDLAIAADGTLIAAWPRRTATTAALWTASKAPGQAWTSPQRLSRTVTDGTGAVSPQLTAGDGGAVLAAWQTAAGPEYASRAANGTWSAPMTFPASARYGARLLPDGSGGATAFWTQTDQDTAISSLWWASQPAGGAWSAPVALVSPPAGRYVSGFDVVRDGSSALTLVWAVKANADADVPFGTVSAATRPAGGAWSVPADLSTGVGNGAPRVAVTDTGAAAVIWPQDGRTGEDRRGQRVLAVTRASASAAWRAPTQVAGVAEHGLDSLKLVANAAGVAVAAWNLGTGFDLSAAAMAAVNDDITAGVPHAPVDTTAPTITVTSPTEGQVFTVGQTVSPVFSCADEPGGSGLAACEGPSTLDTSSAGVRSFTISAEDRAGNRSSVKVSFTIRAADTPSPDGGQAPPPTTPSPAIQAPRVQTTQAQAKPPKVTLGSAVSRSRSLSLTFANVADGAKVTVTFRPKKGSKTVRSAKVRRGKATVKPPSRKGTYKVTVNVAGRKVATRTVRVT